MKRKLQIIAVLSGSVLSLSGMSANASCPEADSGVEVSYQLTGSVDKELVYWRHGSIIAWEMPGKGVVQQWRPLKDGRAQLIKLFPQAGRGVQYEPADLAILGRTPVLGDIANLTTPQRLGFKEPDSVSHFECYQVERYVSDQTGITLDWIPQLKVVKELRDPEQDIHWIATNVNTRSDAIARQFNHWDHYELIDFADIGDMEADPFVRDMINLGFVEHGGSGAWYANGEPVPEFDGHSH